MYAVKPCVFALQNEVGAAYIGCQHGLFDQLVRVVAGTGDDLLDAATFIADDLRLDGFKIDRAALVARCQESAVDIMQIEQIGYAVFAPCRFRPLGVGQYCRDFVVSKARVAEHHRRVKLVGRNLAASRHKHVAHHAQALDIGVQRAQAVGQFFGQHGNDATRKIHAGGAIIGININRRAVVHVMAYIGNRDQQTPTFNGGFAPALSGRFTVHRIVKVARIFTVDGDQRNVGQVNPVLFVGGQNLVRQGTRQGDAGIRKFMRHAVLAHGDFDLHAGVVDLAQHLLHTAYGLAEERGRLDQLNHHHLTRFGGTRGPFGDQDVLPVALVFRGDQPDAAFLQQAPDDGLRRTLDDLNHAPLRAAFAVAAHDARLDAIFVQHRPHFVGRQVNVGPAVIA